MRQSRKSQVLLFVVASSVPLTATAAPSPLLTRMECIAPQVEQVTAEEERFELTTPLIESYLVTGVKKLIPSVPVEEACRNVVYLNVGLVGGEGQPGAFYSTRLRLEVRRMATVIDSGRQGLVTVWDSEAFVIGEKFEVQQTTLQTIEEMIGSLAADLRASGNL